MNSSPAMGSNHLTEKEREWLQSIAEGRNIHVTEAGWTVISREIDQQKHVFLIKWKEIKSGEQSANPVNEPQPASVYCFKLQPK